MISLIDSTCAQNGLSVFHCVSMSVSEFGKSMEIVAWLLKFGADVSFVDYV